LRLCRKLQMRRKCRGDVLRDVALVGRRTSGAGQHGRSTLGSVGRTGNDLDDPEAKYLIGDSQAVFQRLQQ